MLNTETGVEFRACSHSGCNSPAEATIGFHYASRLVWFEELKSKFELDHYDLCEVHLQRFAPPRGWETQDRRKAHSRTA
jgi:hypothetical protein